MTLVIKEMPHHQWHPFYAFVVADVETVSNGMEGINIRTNYMPIAIMIAIH